MSRHKRTSLTKQTLVLAGKYPPGSKVLVAPDMKEAEVLGYHSVTSNRYTRMQLFVNVDGALTTIADEKVAVIEAATDKEHSNEND